jgi:FkbM family methyltransferase
MYEDIMRDLSTIKRFVRWFPASWQYHLSLFYYRYSIRHEPEPAEFAVIKPLLDAGATIVDAGANIGVYSLFLARHVGPDAKVVSIEPIPTTYAILQSNLASLKIYNVHTLRCALSDRHRHVVMEVPSDEHGREVHYLARIKFTDQGRPVSSSHEVEAHPLDDVLPVDGRRVCFIKYDVEMHELEAITGSLKIIRRDHPAIYAEIQPDLRYKRSQRDDIVALLAHEGYLPYWYDGDVLRAFEPGGRTLDYFFLTSLHCRQLADAGVRVVPPNASAPHAMRG